MFRKICLAVLLTLGVYQMANAQVRFGFWKNAQSTYFEVGDTLKPQTTSSGKLQAGYGPLPVTLATGGIVVDTTITVGTTPVRLSTLISNMGLNLIKFYNNTSGARLYVGSNSNVLNHGDPINYEEQWYDGIGYYRDTYSIWLVASTDTNVRIKLRKR